MSAVTLESLRADFVSKRDIYRGLTPNPLKHRARCQFDAAQFADLFDHLKMTGRIDDPAWPVAKAAKLWRVCLLKGPKAAMLWKLAN